MRFIFKIILVLFFLFIPPVLATADQIKDKFFSSIENFLDGNFEDTDFSIKSKEGNKP